MTTLYCLFCTIPPSYCAMQSHCAICMLVVGRCICAHAFHKCQRERENVETILHVYLPTWMLGLWKIPIDCYIRKRKSKQVGRALLTYRIKTLSSITWPQRAHFMLGYCLQLCKFMFLYTNLTTYMITIILLLI